MPFPSSPQGNREVALKSYSAVKTLQNWRNEWRLSSCAISHHFTFIQCLGHQPAGTWQPQKAGKWPEGPRVELEGSGPQKEATSQLQPSLPCENVAQCSPVFRLCSPREAGNSVFMGTVSARKPLAWCLAHAEHATDTPQSGQDAPFMGCGLFWWQWTVAWRAPASMEFWVQQ